jgi:hypothetical protein
MAGQVAEHMPLDSRIGYAQLYDEFNWYAQRAADETDAWSVLGELDDPHSLGPEDLAIVREARSRAQVAADKLSAYLPQIVAAGEQLGVKPSPVIETSLTAKAVRTLCQPMS